MVLVAELTFLNRDPVNPQLGTPHRPLPDVEFASCDQTVGRIAEKTTEDYSESCFRTQCPAANPDLEVKDCK